jgi:hypothetical protein
MYHTAYAELWWGLVLGHCPGCHYKPAYGACCCRPDGTHQLLRCELDGVLLI